MSMPTNPPGIDNRTPSFAETAGTYASRETEYPGTHGSVRRGDDALCMETIELYTRPGCPFCFTLRRRLRKHGIEFREINIWNDPEARERVRAADNGNETVPTVHVGDRWLVNPTVKDIATQIRRITTGNSSAATQHRDDDPRHDRIVLNPPASLPVPRTTMKETPEPRHHLHECIRAARDIRIYRTTVISCGAPGIVVAINANPGRETYTAEFQPARLAGATIRARGLTDSDLQGRDPPDENA